MAEANTGARAVLEQLRTLWGKQSRGRKTLAIFALALGGVVGWRYRTIFGRPS